MSLASTRLHGRVRFGVDELARLLAPLVLSALSIALVASDASPQDTVRVSVSSSGAEGDAKSAEDDVISISADGNLVAFSSAATTLVTNDLNGSFDVFVHDRTTGITERVSVDSSGNEGDADSLGPSISSDGTIVSFYSLADNLAGSDTNQHYDLFVHDRTSGITERVSVSSSGGEANSDSYSSAISADNRFVAFDSRATNLVPGGTNGSFQIFVRDRTLGTTELVSVSTTGDQGNDLSFGPSISSDGGLVVFGSYATNLVPGDSNRAMDVFVRDRSAATTERVSVTSSGAEANGPSTAPAISRDGQLVAFESSASNLVSGDNNGFDDVFVRDRTAGVTERISVDSAGVEANGSSGNGAPSADGQFVAFWSRASNLVSNDTNSKSDIFLRDRSNGTTERVSVDSAGAEGDDECWFNPCVSDDGQSIAFGDAATNLVANDTNGVPDCFVHDRCAFQAGWSNYGSGFPGSNGVPSFTSNANPVFGASLDLSLDNSYGQPTIGLVLVGFQQANVPTNRGGDLLVTPAITLLTTFSYGSNSYSGTIPDDRLLCGTTIDCQALELDPGAAYGISFTQGLELTIGR